MHVAGPANRTIDRTARLEHLGAVDPSDGRGFNRVRDMRSASSLDGRLVRVGVIAGAAAVTTYLVKTFLPLPDAVEVAFFLCRGPLVVIAFLGFYPFLVKPAPSVGALLGTVFGVIAGAATMLFGAIQLSNLHYIRGFIRAAGSPEAAETWRDILQGVFTVQNGVSYVADFFLDGAAFLFALSMWKHPKLGWWWSVLSVVLVGPHFIMKVITFPEPPAEAGLFDAGPLVSIWFALVLVQVVRNLRWMDGSSDTPSAA